MLTGRAILMQESKEQLEAAVRRDLASAIAKAVEGVDARDVPDVAARAVQDYLAHHLTESHAIASAYRQQLAAIKSATLPS